MKILAGTSHLILTEKIFSIGKRAISVREGSAAADAPLDLRLAGGLDLVLRGLADAQHLWAVRVLGGFTFGVMFAMDCGPFLGHHA